MKRSVYFAAAVILMLVAANFAAAQSQTQPLGDYARAAKKAKDATATKAAPKVYDNDNLPRTTSISVVGDAASDTSGDQKDAASDDKNTDGTPKQDAQSADKKNEPQLKPGQSADERQQALNAWKDKLGGQQDKVNLLSRELSVLQGEYRVKSADFYSNVAMRTQNPTAFAAEDEKYKQQIADKEKQLDDAKAKLSDMQDDARKAGAPTSVTETDSPPAKN
jgi:hypothetical protein